eukprot:3974724-Pyramimonas_sp.AAC.1
MSWVLISARKIPFGQQAIHSPALLRGLEMQSSRHPRPNVTTGTNAHPTFRPGVGRPGETHRIRRTGQGTPIGAHVKHLSFEPQEKDNP